MSRPNWMVENVVAGLQNLVATLDTIAAGNGMDTAKADAVSADIATGATPSLSVSAPLATVTGLSAGLVALYNALPLLVSDVTGIDPSVVPALFALARGLGGAMDPIDAATAFAAAIDDLPDAAPAPTSSPNRLADAANMQIVARVSRMVLIAPYAEALIAVPYASRQDGVTARADCVERFEREIEASTGADAGGDDLSVVLADSRNSVVEFLSRVITNTAPIVTVTAKRSLPALVWAWKLYQDPSRAADLVARNGVPHPSFMPLQFDAVAPTS
jgi:prophage DNA circulation protein